MASHLSAPDTDEEWDSALPDSVADDAREFYRTLLDRNEYLRSEIHALAGKYSARSNDGVAKAISIIQEFPEYMRRQLRRELMRAPSRHIEVLEHLAEQLIRASKLIQEWFQIKAEVDIPIALVEELNARLPNHVVECHLLATTAQPGIVESGIVDLKAQLFPDTDSQDDSLALLKISSHEAASPLWWPIMLGHELTHLRLNSQDLAPQKTLLAIGILESFPKTRMREIKRTEYIDELFGATNSIGFAGGRSDVLETIESSEAFKFRVATSVDAQITVANDWVEECICDLTMIRNFGPAGLTAMAHYLAAQSNLHLLTPTHPPGRFRIATMKKYLDHLDDECVLESMYTQWTANQINYQTAISQAERLIFEFIDGNLPALFAYVDSLPGERYEANSRMDAILLAERQFSQGLPPYLDDSECYPEGIAQTAKLVSPAEPRNKAQSVILEDIITAGWLVSMSGSNDPEKRWHKIPVERLALKAVETLQLLTRIHDVDVPDIDETPRTPPAIRGAILGGKSILYRIETHDFNKRLMVTPLLKNAVQDGGIDIRLGNRFIAFQRSGIAAFNAVEGNDPRAVQRLIECSWDSPFVLHPGELVLASALEYVALPEDIGAQVITRSSYGRLGLITATAVQVHPLYHGCLTLELVNLGSVPLQLYPGERIAQLVFFNVDHHADQRPENEIYRAVGSFNCPTGPEFPAIKVEEWIGKKSQI